MEEEKTKQHIDTHNMYTVYFEIYGKKMKATIEANSEKEAKELIKNKIKFHKIEDNNVDYLRSIFNIK